MKSKRNISAGLACLLIVGSWGNCQQVNAQGNYVYSYSVSVKSKMTRHNKSQTLTLKKLLKQYQTEFGMNFLCKSDLLELTFTVNPGFELKNQPQAESYLSDKLREYQLRYKKIAENQYAINYADIQTEGISFNLQSYLPSVTYSNSSRKLSDMSVSGIVTTANDGLPLPGVSVLVKGTSNGVSTGVDGKYTLENVPESATLVFSFMGFVSQEIAVNNKAVINVQMKPDISTLDEVIVVGYGTTTKVTKTGAVSAVSGEDLEKSPVVDLSNSLAGRVPGLVAFNRSGQPGYSGSTIYIRGRSTMGNNSPLVVIDGIPDRGGFGRLNPNDIASVSVLKDASAAIYGARAANGVILITTKRGIAGPATVSYGFNQGLTEPTRLPEMADAATYAQVVNEISASGGDPEPYTEEDIQKFKDGSAPWTHPNTDWFDELIKPLSPMSKHDLSLRGGTEDFRYFASLGALFQDGLYENSATKYNQYSTRINLDADVGESIKIRFGLAGRLEDRNFPPRSAGSIFRATMRGNPTLPARWPNGMPGPDIEYGDNPVVTGTNAIGYDRHDRYVLNGTLGATVEIPWVNGLSLDGNFALDRISNFQKRWIKPWYLYTFGGFDESGEPILNAAARGVSSPELWQSYSRSLAMTANIRFIYKRSFGSHNLNTFIAYEQIDQKGDDFSGQRRYFLSEAIDQMFAGSNKEKDITGGGFELARKNYFGRVSYNFDEKYLLDFNWRVDGSQRFPKEKRFGFFPGVGAGWVISSEDFWDFPLGLTFFKVRGSWGQLGNDLVPNFQYLSTYGLEGGAMFGGDYNQSIHQVRTPNPIITWEVSNNYNAGIEGEILSGRWGFEADYFYNNRSQILIDKGAAFPDYTGLILPDENLGEVKNQGFEALVWHRNQIGDFIFNVSANASYANNEVVYLAEPANVPAHQRTTGKPIATNLYYKAIGVFNDEEDVNAYPHLDEARPGDVIFADVDGDGEITDLDRIRVDENEVPKWMFGLNFIAQYKNFDLSLLMQGAAGSHQYVRTESGLIGNFPMAFLEDRWTDQNHDASYPRAFDRNREYWVNRDNTFWWWDTDYIRLKTVQIGYAFPAKVRDKVGLEELYIFVSGQNLLTFDKVDIFDPEVPGGSGQYYPQTKVYNFGINITF